MLLYPIGSWPYGSQGTPSLFEKENCLICKHLQKNTDLGSNVQWFKIAR